MTEDFRLSAEPRELLGSANTRRLRLTGRVPANLYGFKKDSLNLSVTADDVERLIAGGSRVVDVEIDGTVDKAVVQEVQWNVFSTYVRHLDMKRVDVDSIVTVEVPLEIQGEALGIKDGGQLKQSLKRVTVTCQDFRVPKTIAVRVGALNVGDSLKVSDLRPPETVKIDTDADAEVVQVFDPKKAAAEAAEA